MILNLSFIPKDFILKEYNKLILFINESAERFV
jgi:hypothetical protein